MNHTDLMGVAAVNRLHYTRKSSAPLSVGSLFGQILGYTGLVRLSALVIMAVIVALLLPSLASSQQKTFTWKGSAADGLAGCRVGQGTSCGFNNKFLLPEGFDYCKHTIFWAHGGPGTRGWEGLTQVPLKNGIHIWFSIRGGPIYNQYGATALFSRIDVVGVASSTSMTDRVNLECVGASLQCSPGTRLLPTPDYCSKFGCYLRHVPCPLESGVKGRYVNDIDCRGTAKCVAP